MPLQRSTLLSTISALGFGLALWSAVAFAQAGIPDDNGPTPSAMPEPAAVSAAAPVPTSAPETGSEDRAPVNVEDAPIEEPPAIQSHWRPAPLVPEPTFQKPVSKRAKPARKALTDGETSEAEPSAWGDTVPEPRIATSARQRERKIDPVKRAELTGLARVLGALHALRVSCSGRDDQTYRSRMSTLLDLEAPNEGVMRDPLVDAFNGGFQTNGRGTNICPDDSRVREAALAKQGFNLAKALSARYRPETKPPSEPKQARATSPKKMAEKKWAANSTASRSASTGSAKATEAGQRPEWSPASGPPSPSVLPPPQAIVPPNTQLPNGQANSIATQN